MSGHARAVVTNKGARRWAAGHPWIFRSDVTTRPATEAGAVTVVDPRGKELGTALWSPRSEISLRLVDQRPDVALEQSWWSERLARAMQSRENVASTATAYRVVHAEGDGLPSLVVDRYGDCLVVQLLSAGLEAFREQIIAGLNKIMRPAPAGILARHDAPVREREGLPRAVELLSGDVPRDIEVVEDGVRYLAAPWEGQKTGAFLDQRENRSLVAAVARGNALDCFSYHGSFSLHLARGAESVLALDSSAAALSRAHQNAALNGLHNIRTLQADAFDYLREANQAGVRFDTIVLDPPAFAKNRASVAGALRGYKELNIKAMRLLAPHGFLFTASCSYHVSRAAFLETLADAAADSGRRMILREVRGQASDHPEVLNIPETGYLKAALLQAAD